MLIYLQSLLLLCHAAMLLTLILTLYLRSSPLLPSQAASLATLPSLTARLVPILSQNVMPIPLTSVITSTPRKPIMPQIKREPPHQFLVTTRANCSFCTGRIVPFNTVMVNITSVKYLPSNVGICAPHKKRDNT